MNYQIKPATLEWVRLMLAWADVEGWNPGLKDDLSFYVADNNGFFIGYLDDKPISCISKVKYSEEYSFIGFYIVHPDYRGKGYGYKIWQYALNHNKTNFCALDAVLEQQDNYKKEGFKFAYRNLSYAMHPGILTERASEFLCNPKDADITELVKFDAKCFPAPRKMFLQSWIGSYTAYMYKDHEEIRGYGVIRPCSTGYKIGPLFAENREIAQDILVGLVNSIPKSSTVYIDLPDANPQALLLVEYFKMTARFETARMYLNGTPEVNMDYIFGATTLELG